MFGGDTFATAGNSSTYLPRPSRLSVILKLEIYVPGGALS